MLLLRRVLLGYKVNNTIVLLGFKCLDVPTHSIQILKWKSADSYKDKVSNTIFYLWFQLRERARRWICDRKPPPYIRSNMEYKQKQLKSGEKTKTFRWICDREPPPDIRPRQDQTKESKVREQKKWNHGIHNKLAKLRRHASQVHFAKIHFGWLYFGSIKLGDCGDFLGDGGDLLGDGGELLGGGGNLLGDGGKLLGDGGDLLGKGGDLLGGSFGGKSLTDLRTYGPKFDMGRCWRHLRV